LRKSLLGKSRGSVESFLIIIPQVFIFLIMFQLVFVQFSLMRQVHLSQAELTQVAILGKSSGYVRYPLIGGGSVLLLDKRSNSTKFVDFSSLVSKKVVSIAIDEDERD
jgi:hypothetical protein